MQLVPRPPMRKATGFAAFPELIAERGVITRNQLEMAERHSASEHIDLADALVALNLTSEDDAFSVLAEAAGTEFVSLLNATPSELALRLVPERIARKYLAVPLAVDGRTLRYATCRPFNQEAERDLGFASGRRTEAVVATRSSVREALDRCYPKLRELDVLAERLQSERPSVKHESVSGAADGSSTVIEFCNHIIARAVDVGASDVHVDSGKDGATIRYRVCGVLEPVLTLPASAAQPISDRFKIFARVGVALRHRPQDGAFRLQVGGRHIDVRLSSLPTQDGEKLVMRVSDSTSPLQSLDRLGYDEPTRQRFERALARPDGLVLVTGPAGSGKSTALYAALGHLQTNRSNLVSIEDPVERNVPGVTQTPVNVRAGNTFAAVLRSVLRQAPNAVMVGEIRDGEVAQIVGQAALTGHLVLSSLQAADAATAISRLASFGLKSSKIAESLAAVLAQRLVRTLCPQCRNLHNDMEARRRGNQHGMPPIPASAGPGCERCKDTGFVGRMPIAELLTPSDELREVIARGGAPHELRAAMRAAGYASMRDRAMQLVADGTTSIEEVDRVLPPDADSSAPKKGGRLRALIVEDEAITRMLLKLLLEREQFQVFEAADGRQGVELAIRERPDVAIVDLNMPEMDGYEAIGRLRRDLTLVSLPIIVLTADDGPGVERRVLEIGADDYMLKPFEPAVLLSRVNAVFQRLRAMTA